MKGPRAPVDEMGVGVRTFEQEDSPELHIARDALNKKDLGSFLTFFFESFIWADRENFELLRPVARTLIEKYGLRCYCGEGVRLESVIREGEKNSVKSTTTD